MAEGTRKKAYSAKSKGRIIIFAIEFFLILIMLAVLVLVLNIGGKGPSRPEVSFEDEDIGITDSNGSSSGGGGSGESGVNVTYDEKYTNIALFGVDATTSKLYDAQNENYHPFRSDCIMIASINNETKEIRLVSVYRDTYLNIGTDDYYKCNQAYMRGGPKQALKMLNINLDLRVREFVTVGYTSLIELIDGLGGIYIDINSGALKHINNYQITIMNDLGLSGYTPVTETGYQLLNGLQAAAFCRIRYDVGDDYGRAANQRKVIKAIEAKAQQTDVVTLTKVFNKVVEDIYTNIDNKTLLEFVKSVNSYHIVEEGGFPEETMRGSGKMGAKGSIVYAKDLESNVLWLHQFLFEDENYVVPDTVKDYSNKIKSDIAEYSRKNPEQNQNQSQDQIPEEE